MKNVIFKTTLSLLTVLSLVSCGSSSNTNTSATVVQDAIDSPPSVLSQELIDSLSHMGNEERLAYDVYNRLYTYWGTQQFINIASQSEIEHIQSVQQLVQKYALDDTINFTNVDLPTLGYMYTPVEDMQAGTYDISKIQGLYEDLTAAGAASEIEALKVGCTVEVVDITDLSEYILLAIESNANDIVDVFNVLRDGSYSHYWAFDTGLKDRGVSEGCCTWSELCHPEYPDEDNGNGNGRHYQ